MAKKKTRTDALLGKLMNDKSSFRSRAVALWVNFLLDQPLRSFIDLNETTDWLVDAISGSGFQRFLEERIQPNRARWQERLAQEEGTAENFLGTAAVGHLETIVARGSAPRAAWARGAVDPVLVRRLLSPVLQEILLSFAKKLPLPSRRQEGSGPYSSGASMSGLGIRKRLKNKVGKHAEQLVDAGKNVLDGLGVDLEGQIRQTASEFSQSAFSGVRQTFRQRLKSEEGQRLLREMRLALLRAFLEAPISEIASELNEMPTDDADNVVAAVVAHLCESGRMREIIGDEVASLLEQEGDRSLRDVLQSMSARAEFERIACARTDVLARTFLATEEVRALLEEFLD
jgi:hypothetical protein